ncbi:hypothetical protein HID58_052828, partial [Brassica napus]
FNIWCEKPVKVIKDLGSREEEATGEGQRECIFVGTLYNGFPLMERQIFDYFNLIYAPYVKLVNLPSRGPSLFVKLVFKKQLIPRFLMGNNELFYFLVEEHIFYCKRFVSKKTKTATTLMVETTVVLKSYLLVLI